VQHEPPATHGDERGPRRLPARLAHFRSARRRSALGLPEIAALAAAALLLLTAVCSYLFLLRPQRVRLAEAESEREGLQRQLQTTRGTLDENQDTQSSVREILASLEKFEIDHLGVSGAGSTGVIEELYNLLGRNGLRVSGGMSYTELQEAVPGATPGRPIPRAGGQEGAQQRIVQSVFPGVGVTLTVEGAYPALRRFIRDVESSRHFIVVNAVELEGITESGGSAPVVTGPADPDGNGALPSSPAPPVAASGRLVSLRLELAAYFRRTGAGAQ
jgi:hypothetical protein